MLNKEIVRKSMKIAGRAVGITALAALWSCAVLNVAFAGGMMLDTVVHHRSPLGVAVGHWISICYALVALICGGCASLLQWLLKKMEE